MLVQVLCHRAFDFEGLGSPLLWFHLGVELIYSNPPFQLLLSFAPTLPSACLLIINPKLIY